MDHQSENTLTKESENTSFRITNISDKPFSFIILIFKEDFSISIGLNKRIVDLRPGESRLFFFSDLGITHLFFSEQIQNYHKEREQILIKILVDLDWSFPLDALIQSPNKASEYVPQSNPVFFEGNFNFWLDQINPEADNFKAAEFEDEIKGPILNMTLENIPDWQDFVSPEFKEKAKITVDKIYADRQYKHLAYRFPFRKRGMLFTDDFLYQAGNNSNVLGLLQQDQPILLSNQELETSNTDQIPSKVLEESYNRGVSYWILSNGLEVIKQQLLVKDLYSNQKSKSLQMKVLDEYFKGLDLVLYRYQDMPILMHGYDYFDPNLVYGWMLNQPDFKEIDFEKDFPQSLIFLVIDRFNNLLQALTYDHNNLIYLDLRNTIKTNPITKDANDLNWSSAFTPSPRSAELITAKIKAAIDELSDPLMV